MPGGRKRRFLDRTDVCAGFECATRRVAAAVLRDGQARRHLLYTHAQLLLGSTRVGQGTSRACANEWMPAPDLSFPGGGAGELEQAGRGARMDGVRGPRWRRCGVR